MMLRGDGEALGGGEDTRVRTEREREERQALGGSAAGAAVLVEEGDGQDALRPAAHTGGAGVQFSISPPHHNAVTFCFDEELVGTHGQGQGEDDEAAAEQELQVQRMTRRQSALHKRLSMRTRQPLSPRDGNKKEAQVAIDAGDKGDRTGRRAGSMRTRGSKPTGRSSLLATRPRSALQSDVQGQGQGQGPTMRKRASSMGNSRRKLDRATQNWTKQQETEFVAWLNFCFCPTADADAGNLLSQKMEQSMLQQLTAIVAEDDVQASLRAVKEALENGGIVVKPDCDLHADVYLRSFITGLLMAYNPKWLALVFAVVFHKAVPRAAAERGQQSARAARMRSNLLDMALKTFITDHVLTDAATTEKYCKKAKVPSGSFGEMYRNAMSQHVIGSVLSVVYVLDRVGVARISQDDVYGCLFRKESTFKNTGDVLTAFCRECLGRQGDFLRHMHHIGYNVAYEQTYIDEFDFRVTSLATDLRDGVRLARLVDILTATTQEGEDSDSMPLMRVPAGSRLQRLHNVGVALQKLAKHGVHVQSISARDIADGHRERTLLLLGQMQYTFQFTLLLDIQAIEQEIREVQQSQSWRDSCYTRRAATGGRAAASANGAGGETAEELAVSREQDHDAYRVAIIAWCNAVAGLYGCTVHNLGSDLADGKALCFLLHYYQPSLLPLEQIRGGENEFIDLQPQEVAHNFMMVTKTLRHVGGVPVIAGIGTPRRQQGAGAQQQQQTVEDKWMVVMLGYMFSRLQQTSKDLRSAMRIQKAWRRAIGHMAQTHTLKAQIRQEEERKQRALRAAAIHAIQTWSWHMILKARAKRRVQQVRNERQRALLAHAATAIQSRFRRHSAVVRVRALQQAHARHISAATTLQGAWRSHAARVERARRQQLRQAQAAAAKERAAVLLQCFWRQSVAVVFLVRLRSARDVAQGRAAKAIQCMWRVTLACRRMQLLRIEYSQVQESAAVRMQCFWRQCVARARVQAVRDAFEAERTAGATTMQSFWRTVVARRQLQQLREACAERQHLSAVRIQCAWRCMEARLQMQAARATFLAKQVLCAVTVQCFWRTVLARRACAGAQRAFVATQASAAVRMQCFWRQFVARARLQAARDAFEAKRTAGATTMQSFWRTVVARRQLQQLREACAERQHLSAVRIQCAWRCMEARLQMQAARATFLAKQVLCAVTVQCFWRTVLARRAFAGAQRALVATQASAAVRMQCFWRQFVARARLQAARGAFKAHQELAATVLQSLWRSAVARAHLLRLREAFAAKQIASATAIQCVWRSAVARPHLLRLREAFAAKQIASATAIQCVWRSAVARVTLQSLQKAKAAREATLRNVRETIAARQLQWWVRLRVLSPVSREDVAVLRIQSVVRAFKVRCKLNPQKLDLLARVRLANATARAHPEMRLCNTTAHAVQVLSSTSRLSAVLKACRHLEISTRLLHECCEALAESDGIHNVLVFSQSCNRSRPHTELLLVILHTLVNVVRRESLANRVLQTEEQMELVIDIIQMYRDNDDVILLACEILMPAVCGSIPSDVRSIVGREDIIKRLTGLVSIMKRKQQIRSRFQGSHGPTSAAAAAAQRTAAIEALSTLLEHLGGAGSGHERK